MFFYKQWQTHCWCRKIWTRSSSKNSTAPELSSLSWQLVFNIVFVYSTPINEYFCYSNLWSNRSARFPWMSAKYLKKKDRGTFDCHIHLNSSLFVLKWFDNKAVILVSNFVSVGVSSIRRKIMWMFLIVLL